jgi:hypothetical protein
MTMGGVKLARKNPTGMGNVLLVKLENYACLFRVDTFRLCPFKAWSDENGVDLYWKGRRVEKVYSMSASGERWWSVPVPAAVKSLLKRGSAVKVKEEPEVEGDLPE